MTASAQIARAYMATSLWHAGGNDRWEPKGRGRGGIDPLWRGPPDGVPDRWVAPADAVRPARVDKWGPAEGETQHRPSPPGCLSGLSALTCSN